MDLNELLKTSPEGLAELQFKELKKHVIGVLSKAMTAIETENFKKAEDFCVNSPAGDGWGTDHNFIDFSPENGEEGDDGWDFVEVCDKLNHLKELSNPKKKK